MDRKKLADKLVKLANEIGKLQTASRDIEPEDVAEKVKIKKVSGELPIYMKYDRQLNPQRAYFYLDLESGEVGADWRADDTISGREYRGLVLTFYVTPYLRATDINRELRFFAKYAQKILDAYRDSADVESLVRRAEGYCEDIQSKVSVWDCADWAENDYEKILRKLEQAHSQGKLSDMVKKLSKEYSESGSETDIVPDESEWSDYFNELADDYR